MRIFIRPVSTLILLDDHETSVAFAFILLSFFFFFSLFLFSSIPMIFLVYN